ncbi:MAG: hypothetical protein WBX25_22580 [Rhodomicrobium sp.]
MRKIEACLNVAQGDRTVLERLIADGKTPQKLAARARIVLLSGRSLGTTQRLLDKLAARLQNATNLMAGSMISHGVSLGRPRVPYVN